MIVGLTGGIGSGKSAAGIFFELLGITTIDADQLAKDVIAKDSPGYHCVINSFGQSILDSSGSIDRASLRVEAFNNPERKKLLESIIHPLVKNAMFESIAASKSMYSIIMVPLIFESNSMTSYDRILVIDCKENLQLSRASVRDKNSSELIQKIIDSQCSREERLSIANDVIPNNDSLEDLKLKVSEIHNFYLELSKND